MLYDVAFLIFSLFYLPALIFKGKLHGDFGERFGNYGSDKRKALAAAKGAIWVQAVSVGEIALCGSLIPKLKAGFPDKRIVLSTITKTGNDLAKKRFSNDALVIYFPLDLSFIVRKTVSLIRPCIYIMIETEIWPNLLKETADNNIPAILLNGRISDRSFGKYMLAGPFIKNTLARIDRFCMQSGLDAERVISMGAPKARVTVTGNMKFDAEISADTRTVDALKETLSLKADEELLVAGSTHRGEEEIVMESYKELAGDFPGLRLLIAPRHIERAAEVDGIIRKFGFKPFRLSAENREPNTEHRIFILDRIGYLTGAYSFATIVFVGGSLVRHGGQNPIEPAIFEKAVLFGPHMFNFKEISEALLKNNGAIQVSDKKEFIDKARYLLKDKSRRDALGKNAKQAVSSGRGATLRNLEAVKGLIDA